MAAQYEIKQILLNLMAAYPDWKPSSLDKTIEQYITALQQYKVETIEHAANVCRDTCLFFPKIAEIKKAINESFRGETERLYYYNKNEEMKPCEYTPELAKMLADFRQHMIDKGKWKEHRPSKYAMRGLE